MILGESSRGTLPVATPLALCVPALLERTQSYLDQQVFWSLLVRIDQRRIILERKVLPDCQVQTPANFSFFDQSGLTFCRWICSGHQSAGFFEDAYASRDIPKDKM